MGTACSQNGRRRQECFQNFTKKRLLGRLEDRREDNITTDLEEIDVSTWNCIGLALDRGYWIALVNETPDEHT